MEKTDKSAEEILDKLSPGLLQFISDMFDNINKVSELNRPMMWQVGLVNTGDGTKLSDFVNIWAGIGGANPIKRIEQLVNQKEALKNFIVLLSKKHELSDDEKANMILLLSSF